jgi:hypothetical protein
VSSKRELLLLKGKIVSLRQPVCGRLDFSDQAQWSTRRVRANSFSTFSTREQQMKTYASWILLAGLGLVLMVPQGLSEDEQMSPEQMAQMMEMWQKLSEPGDPHKLLHESVGEWDIQMKSYWQGPDVPPQVTSGTSSIKSILGGRFIQESLKCDMMLPGPDGVVNAKFEGLGTTGYDNYQKVYVSSWCDNMNTAYHTLRGSRNPKTSVLTMYGQMDEPMLGVRGRMVRSVFEMMGKDKAVFKMYDLHAAEDYLVMEIVYTRKQ